MIWAAISTVLFLVLAEKNYGGVFRAPITNLLTQLVGFAFVDDTDLFQTQHHNNETTADVVEELQGSLDTWQCTLNTLGGALDCDDPNKIYWCIIDYERNSNRRWKYCVYDEDLRLMIYDDVGGRKEVPHFKLMKHTKP